MKKITILSLGLIAAFCSNFVSSLDLARTKFKEVLLVFKTQDHAGRFSQDLDKVRGVKIVDQEPGKTRLKPYNVTIRFDKAFTVGEIESHLFLITKIRYEIAGYQQ